MEYFGGQYIPSSGKMPEYGKKKEEKKEHEMGFMKKLFFWIMLLAFTVGFAVTLAEVVLRAVPGQWSNTFFHRYDPVLGTWHIESHTGDYRQQDFDTKGISINAFGMRDRERTLERQSSSTVRIAVLGDSFTEAFHVANEETFTRVLEDGSKGAWEVMNFGVSGFGTVQELLTYREHVRQFKPDVVVLAFLPANDMRNNLKQLEDAYTGNSNIDRPFVERRATNTWVIMPPQPKPSANNPALLYVKKHFTLYRFLWYAKGTYQARFATVPADVSGATTTSATVATTTATNINAYLAKLFAPPKEQEFVDAWEGTEWAIKTLKQEVEKDGGKFVLLVLPDAVAMEKDPRATLESQYGVSLPKEYDIDYPAKRLSQFSKKEKINYYDLTSEFRKERDRNNMKAPFFSYEHDGHWAPVGHKFAASLIERYLLGSGVLKQ